MVNGRRTASTTALWTPAHARLLKRAASYPEVERIFVNPGIKKKLCDTVTGDRSWLRKVRPFWGHDDHFHVRIGCQPGSPAARGRPDTPGDGCDKSLAWWFTEEPWRPNKNPEAPKARDLMTMASLPKAAARCLRRRRPCPKPPSRWAPAGGPPLGPRLTRSGYGDAEFVPGVPSPRSQRPRIVRSAPAPARARSLSGHLPGFRLRPSYQDPAGKKDVSELASCADRA